MSGLFDLFDDPAPAPAPKAPFIDFSKRDGAADAKAQAARLAAESPCGLPFPLGTHQCRVGGGFAALSDDHGRTWFCRGHAPADFFAHKREVPA